MRTLVGVSLMVSDIDQAIADVAPGTPALQASPGPLRDFGVAAQLSFVMRRYQ